MTEVNGKSPFQLWEEQKVDIETEQAKYDAMVNKNLKPAHAKLAKIEKLKTDLVELELHKDDDVLSETCKTYLANIYGWEKYKKWPVVSGDEPIKQFRKGNLVENDSIKLVSELDGKEYVKNEIKIENEFLSGIPDILENDYLIDVKSPWSIESFLANLTKELNDAYWWQVQGYLSITKFPKGEVSFCLISHPDKMIDDEVQRLTMLGIESSAEQLRNGITFEDIPANERRIKFIVERDDEVIAKINKRVGKCREFLAEIEQLHIKMSENWTNSNKNT